MLSKAAHHGLIEGFLPRIIPGGVISLQYVDVTVLFLKKQPGSDTTLEMTDDLV
jgi:hypothetical protein